MPHQQRPKEWLPLRKGVADRHRLAEVSQASNDRYADALSACDCSEPLDCREYQRTHWSDNDLKDTCSMLREDHYLMVQDTGDRARYDFRWALLKSWWKGNRL